MNWQQFWEANKSLGLEEATRRYRRIEEQKNEEEYGQWLAIQEARGGGSASGAAGAAAGGGGSAVGTALYAPVVTADASTTQQAIVFYWGTVVHANNYIVQRSTDPTFATGVTTVYTGNSPAQNGVPGYVDYSVTVGTTYYYRAKAQDTTATYTDSPYGAVLSTSGATPTVSGHVYGKTLGVDNL